MEISKVYQGTEQTVNSTKSDNNQQVSGKNQAVDNNLAVQKDFQVNLQDGLKIKLTEFANMLQSRQQLMQSLPENIRISVAELLTQMSADTALPQGLENLLKGQKNTVEQLKEMSNILSFSAVLQQDEHSEVKNFLQKTLENFTKQSAITPEQSAKELVQLAKQLPVNQTMIQGVSSQGLAQLLDQGSPERLQQLNPSEEKLLVKLTALLGQDLPTQLQQLTTQENGKGLPSAWALLKTSTAWQFKDTQPKTLQAAAELLTQISREMQSAKGVVVTPLEQFVQSLPPEVSNKGTAVTQLAQFLKTLPPEISKALQGALQQGNIPNSLRALADTFSNAIVLNEHMDSETQSLVGKMINNIGIKSSMVLNNNNLLSQLTPQSGSSTTTIEQLKTLILQLKTQLFAGDQDLLKKQQSTLEQLSTLFPQNIPHPLQEGIAQSKLPDLSKMWVLLKALGSEEWQNTEPRELKKSASVVQELAQSIYKSTGLTGEKQAQHSILSFTIPLQVGEGINYPAHIHIYHEEKNNDSQLPQREFETWLRVCVDTENIGIVESVFRLYADNKLDIRVNFPSTVAANQFAQDLPNIKQSFEGSKLSLTDIMINKT